jgi:large conductance mechanosensitive channel
MLQGFKQFLLRGNVIDLAVAVVIGGAFGAVVAALVKDLLTPLIAAVTINGSQFLIGEFVNALISFLLIAIAVYFFVIVPVNALVARANRGAAPPDPAIKQCSECLSEVPIAAKRCRFCTSPLS